MEDTITLIPEGYTGTVEIWFNQANGEQIEYENDKRIYRIPKNGILNTQFSEQYGSNYPKFYYVNELDNRTEIKMLHVLSKTVLDSIDKNKIYAYKFMLPGGGFKIDSLGNETILEPGIIFTVDYPTFENN